MKRNIASLLLAALTAGIVSAAPAKKPQLYIPMDYSTCGYHASEQPVPDVPCVLFVERAADLQPAIDYVSSLPRNRRGAILIGEGTFELDRPLRISASGIVLRGMGKGRTVLLRRGTDRQALLYVEGRGRQEKPCFTTDKQRNIHLADSTLTEITDDVVRAGSTSFGVKSTAGLRKGMRISIIRPSTWPWICRLGMNDFGGGLDYTGWKPTDIDITWQRVIIGISGNRITVDAPITCTLTAEDGGGYIKTTATDGEITEVGIENLSMKSAKNDWNDKDEDHCWDAITMEYVRDCWVRRVDFDGFAGSAVNLQRYVSRVTVEDCVADNPVSETGGWRRRAFLTRGQQCLFQRCVSRHGLHDFAADYCAAGPNAFVQCEGEQSLGFSGSIGSWATGLLFDVVNIDGSDLTFGNLEQFQMGTGWNTANSMFWQCTASTINCYSPDTLNRSAAHGCWGTLTGNGNWTSSNDHVQPRSLFYDQLEKRLLNGKEKDDALQKTLRRQAALLPMEGEASSSPTVEQAMQMAKASVEHPRLTMEMWMDSIPYTASTHRKGLKNARFIKKKTDEKGENEQQMPIFEVSKSGVLTADGALITGNRYAIPWWSGRVKDNFATCDAKPAVTRFVPGREGTGWTDRLDSVADYLQRNHFAMLDHHYGLWYDLRRTDHERVRRADGDVWPPFYEQPFARSGKGKAWDGLSLYDLNRPNEWYWQRLRTFANKAGKKHILLFNQHYFQHNILEAGAHWVDCPWRTANNVNGTSFPEPVPFAGDKRIFMAEQFYNTSDSVLRPLHKQYIRMCLEQLKDCPNTVHLVSDEYTGPLHFTRFWLETIAEWEAETGHDVLVALSCTKDAQDSILADERLRQVVDIIDIRYWHYNTEGLWAPEAGKNMAPRQWMRKMKPGKTGGDEAYRAVREYRDRYPEKAVTFFAQQYPSYGWALLMAGASLPNVQIDNTQLLHDLAGMAPRSGEGYRMLENQQTGCLIYRLGEKQSISVSPGIYDVYDVNEQSGEVKLSMKSAKIEGKCTFNGRIVWLKKKADGRTRN